MIEVCGVSEPSLDSSGSIVLRGCDTWSYQGGFSERESVGSLHRGARLGSHALLRQSNADVHTHRPLWRRKALFVRESTKVDSTPALSRFTHQHDSCRRHAQWSSVGLRKIGEFEAASARVPARGRVGRASLSLVGGWSRLTAQRLAGNSG